jgi:hypothetical protein
MIVSLWTMFGRKTEGSKISYLRCQKSQWLFLGSSQASVRQEQQSKTGAIKLKWRWYSGDSYLMLISRRRGLYKGLAKQSGRNVVNKMGFSGAKSERWLTDL